MVRTQILLSLALWFLTMTASTGETRQVRQALVRFMTQLSPGNKSMLIGWNTSWDPCHHHWTGVVCYDSTSSVIQIILDGFNLTGTIDANSLCSAASNLSCLILSNNRLVGELPPQISKCTNLELLDVHANSLTGHLPPSLVQLRYTIKFDFSYNGFTGELPYLLAFQFLVYFHAEQNEFNGEVPEFSSYLLDLNVSDSNLSGRIPVYGLHFDASSFSGNPGLCGPPLERMCTLPGAAVPVDGISSSPPTRLPKPFIHFSLTLIMAISFII